MAKEQKVEHVCPVCGGNGFPDGWPMSDCHRCGGTGRVEY